MTNALRPVVGLITIGQSPRVDVVPEMAAVIGPGARCHVDDGLALIVEMPT